MNKKLYLLKAINGWRPWCDCCFAAVVRADTEERARQILNHHQPGDEVRMFGDVWLDPSKTSCEVLSEQGEDDIICTDVWEA